MNITIHGSGYVGLVTGACFAQTGNTVTCVDIDQNRIKDLNNGIIPIYEPGLKELIQTNHKENRLFFTTNAQSAIQKSSIQIIAVGTPQDEDGSADLQYVLKVAETIGKNLNQNTIIITKSTVPVGTSDKVKQTIYSQLADRTDIKNKNFNFTIASNPEFLKEGSAIKDFMKPDRIIIGSEDNNTINIIKDLYAPFSRNHDKLIIMDIRSAELTKYVANAMLATKISFMNEMSQIADRVGADIESVRHGIGSDNRIGYSFIYPGAGYGGSCFPKDVQALYKTAYNHNYEAKIIKAVETTNKEQKKTIINKIKQHFNNNLKNKTFALWGLAFKPGTDDMREAPSRVIIDELTKEDCIVQAYDPKAMPECKRIYKDNKKINIKNTKEETLINADALIIITEWLEFRTPDFKQIKQTLNKPLIFDGRNLYNPTIMKEHGFTYYGIGRSSIK